MAIVLAQLQFSKYDRKKQRASSLFPKLNSPAKRTLLSETCVPFKASPLPPLNMVRLALALVLTQWSSGILATAWTLHEVEAHISSYLAHAHIHGLDNSNGTSRVAPVPRSGCATAVRRSPPALETRIHQENPHITQIKSANMKELSAASSRISAPRSSHGPAARFMVSKSSSIGRSSRAALFRRVVSRRSLRRMYPSRC